MKVRKRRSFKDVEGTFRGKPLMVGYMIHPMTRNLYAAGFYDGAAFEAFVFRGDKKQTIGGYFIQCDAVARRDDRCLALYLCGLCRFNGYLPVKKGM